MAATSFVPHLSARRQIPLDEINAAVAARLGATRGVGNSQPACFNREVAMYLAKHIGNWSTKTIGRYYGGRDHSTVCYGIQRIEALRDSDANVDALVCELLRDLLQEQGGHHEDEDSVVAAVRHGVSKNWRTGSLKNYTSGSKSVSACS